MTDTAAVPLLEPSSEKVRVDCLRRCLALTLCNSLVYNIAEQLCMPMVIQGATRAVEVPGEEKQTVALRVCKSGEGPGRSPVACNVCASCIALESHIA